MRKYLSLTSSILAIFLYNLNPVLADCVYGVKSKTQFQVVDNNTILLTGGYGGSILVKIFCCVYSSSSLTVLKDDFCSYESSALYIDGEVVDVRDVHKIN